MHTTTKFGPGNRAWELAELLRCEGSLTGIEISQRLSMTAVSTFASEARKCLEARRAGTIKATYIGMSQHGFKVWLYVFVPP